MREHPVQSFLHQILIFHSEILCRLNYLSVDIYYDSSLQTRIYQLLYLQVETNGLISFGIAYNYHKYPSFPDPSHYLVAPFWIDTDTSGGNGAISYETYESGYFLDHVSSFLRKNISLSFQGTWMTVVYWDAVHPYPAKFNLELVG